MKVNYFGLPSFCVILPMYNEVDNAEHCIKSILNFLIAEKVNPIAIIAVNDGSTDGTGELLHRLNRNYPNLIIEDHVVNSGYGSAVRTGFAAAIRGGFDYALVMDADGTQNPEFIRAFFTPMKDGVDFIKATRYAKGGRIVGVPWTRRIVSWTGNKLAQLAIKTPLTDYTNGFRAISTDLLRRLNTLENGFPVLMEEIYLAKKLGGTFAEVPYTLNVRQGCKSKSKFVYSIAVYITYVKYLIKR